MGSTETVNRFRKHWSCTKEAKRQKTRGPVWPQMSYFSTLSCGNLTLLETLSLTGRSLNYHLSAYYSTPHFAKTVSTEMKRRQCQSHEV